MDLWFFLKGKAAIVHRRRQRFEQGIAILTQQAPISCCPAFWIDGKEMTVLVDFMRGGYAEKARTAKMITQHCYWLDSCRRLFWVTTARDYES